MPRRPNPPEVPAQRSLQEYLDAVCTYQAELQSTGGKPTGGKKKRQLDLAKLLAEVVASDLRARGLAGARAGETKVSGALSQPRVDVVEATAQDGLKLGVEIKGVNEAAGRAMWNRVGDLRSFAVNFHLKFPYSVCAGIITCPEQMPREPNLASLLRRTEQVLVRVNGRPDESAAPHRLEAICLLVYRCNETGASLHPSMPAEQSGLRYGQFIEAIATTYDGRFFPKVASLGPDEAPPESN